jgi:calcineurin-like phosphoesterase family protein
MSRVFVTSDLHLGHKNLAINYRGFETIESHDEYIVQNWNSVVTKRDVVYILGDITLENSRHYHTLDLLEGKKYVALGNHDSRKHVQELLRYVNGVAGIFEYKGFCMSHIPIHPLELDRYRGNIHGHTHEKSFMDQRYFNVCLDVHEYKPVLFQSILDEFESRK